VATTDNVFATDRGQAQADLFTQVRPGLLYAYDSPRMIQELQGDVELLYYALHSDKPSITAAGGWRGFFLPGPRSQLTFNVNGSNGQLNALSSRTSPDQTTASVVPTGSVDVKATDASEYFSWIATRELRLSQTAFGRWAGTEDDGALGATTTSAGEAGLSFGAERDYKHNSFGIEIAGSVLRLERIAAPGAMPGSRLDRQVNPRSTAVWRHDLDKHWSMSLDGGLVYVNPYGRDPYNPMDIRRGGAFPIYGGLLAYTEMWGRVTVAARRVVAPNMFVAENTLDDSAVAQVALPLPWLDDNANMRQPKLVGLGSLALEHTRLIDSTSSSVQGDFWVGRLDAGVAYTMRPGQTYGVRYELIVQHANDVASALVPQAPSFFRNTIYFTFSLRYPDRVAAQVPRHQQSVRADRKDLSPVGAEPVVPDPTEVLPDQDDTPSDDRR
jgi:hypothetical protein